MKKNYAAKRKRTLFSFFSVNIQQQAKMSSSLILLLCMLQAPIQARHNVEDMPVSISVSNASVKSVFNKIEAQTGLKFFYLNSQLDASRKVTLHLMKTPLKKVLDELFRGTTVSYTITGKHIVLKPLGSVGVMRVDTTDGGAESMPTDDDPAAVGSMEFSVSGTVTGDDGLPLPGVSILVVGTQTGTTTDTNGRYVLDVRDGAATLVFSFIGYMSQEVPLGGRSVIDLKMIADVLSLSEIVVVGYGEMDKKDISQAITTVNGSQMNRMKSSVSIDQMLQGQGPGIQVTQSSGIPASPARVAIRGLHSLSSSSEPLWVIDGIPLTEDNVATSVGNGQNPLATINPNDIESVTVLKDAAATAIYGSRGSKGVILVTTKTGKQGKAQINVNYNTGVSDLTKTPAQMKFVNGPQWTGLINEGRKNTGLIMPITDSLALNLLNPIAAGGERMSPSQITNTNWFDPLLRQGSFQEANISGSKGFDGGNMFLSANYRNDKGVLVGNDFKRFTMRANVEVEPVKNLKAGVRLQLAYSNNKGVRDGGVPVGTAQAAGGGFANAASAPPILPIYSDTTSSGYLNIRGGSNAALSADKNLYRNEYVDYRVLGGFYLDYALPFVKGLSLRSEVSADVDQGNRLNYFSYHLRPSRTSYSDYVPTLSKNLNYNFTATFNKELGEDFRVNVVAGTESQRFSVSTASILGDNISGPNQDISGAATYTVGGAAFLANERYIRSYFTRANVTIKDKYLVGGSFRRDGVSIFKPGQQWSNFYGVSAGWILSRESFMEGITSIDELKLRAGFGQTGNQQIKPGLTQNGYGRYTAYANQPQVQLFDIASPVITWETTNAYDAGIDIRMLDHRVEVYAGYYLQDVKGLLLEAPIPESTGAANTNLWGNVGNINNQGLEFSVTALAFRKGAFEWQTALNLTTNKTTVTSLDKDLDKSGAGIVVGNTKTIKGQKPGTFYMAQWAGIDPKTGMDMIYELDRNLSSTTGATVPTGNVLPATNSNMANNKFFIEGKNGLPTYFGGFSNTLSYKGVEFTAMVSFQGGNYIYGQGTIQPNAIGGTSGTGSLREGIIGKTWTQDRTDAPLYSVLAWNNAYYIDNNGNPTLASDNAYAFTNTIAGGAIDRYIYKGDFIRLRVLQLGYSFPSPILEKLKMQALKISITGNNILTFTGYKGWDPEMVNVSAEARVRNLSQGFSDNTLPPVKTWTLSLNITL